MVVFVSVALLLVSVLLGDVIPTTGCAAGTLGFATMPGAGSTMRPVRVAALDVEVLTELVLLTCPVSKVDVEVGLVAVLVAVVSAAARVWRLLAVEVLEVLVLVTSGTSVVDADSTLVVAWVLSLM